MRKIRFGIVAALMLAFAAPAMAAASAPAKIEWRTDYDQAKSEAESSARPIVLLFTGSDWCGACKSLKREVLDQPEFAEAVGDKFVFVELDFPMKTKLSADASARNNALKQQFDIKGFPTLVILDAKGNKLGSTVGYGGGGVAKVVSNLTQHKG